MSALGKEDFFKTDMYGFTLRQVVADLAHDQDAAESSVAGTLADLLLRADDILGQRITLIARKEDTGRSSHGEFSAERAGMHLSALHGVPEEDRRGLTWDEVEHGDEKEAGTNEPLRWFRIDKKIVIALLESKDIPIPESWRLGKRVKSKHQDVQSLSGEEEQEEISINLMWESGDLEVIVDEVNQRVTVLPKNGKKTIYTRTDIVGKGTVIWDLLVDFAKCKGSLEGNTQADVKKRNTSANRKNLSKKLMGEMNLDKSPIVEGRNGVMRFHSIKLAGGTSSTDAMDRKTCSHDDQATEYIRDRGEDIPVID